MTTVASLAASLELERSSFTSNAEKARRAQRAMAGSTERDTEAMAGSLGDLERTISGVSARLAAL